MHAIFRFFAVAIGLITVTSVACAEPVQISDVLACPAKYHGTLIQISGVFWTDGEGAVLIEAPTEKLDLDRAIGVAIDRKALASDENYQRLKVDRLAYIQKKKADDPKAVWVVFQTSVVFEGRLEDALSLPMPKGRDSVLSHPYGGCRTKIDLRRVISYGLQLNQSAQKTTDTKDATHR